MSLHARFMLLLGLLGAAVIANIGVTVWSVGLLDREQREPIAQIGSALEILNSTKRTLWEQAGQFGLFVRPDTDAESGRAGQALPEDAGSVPAERVAEFRRLGQLALDGVAELEQVEASQVRAGVNTASNLRSRIERAIAGFEASLRGDVDAGQVALTELYTLHELIERLEARLIQEAGFSADHAVQVRKRLRATLIGSVLSVLIVLVTAGWLFRRWVLVRVDRLGVAAERFGRGEFEHRVEVNGDDELDRVGRQLNEMTETIETMQAERVDRERLAAIGDMGRRLAHNIRNPLGGIRSLAELSALELDEASPVREHQHRIIRTVDQFTKWLQDLLSVSNPLAVRMRPVGLPALLGELVETHRALAESRGVSLLLDVGGAPGEVALDRSHFEHVVSALVTNAVQACSRGGRVEVTAETEGSVWRLRVSDDGTGIAPEHLVAMFAPYFTTKQGGTGIGLAQAKRVVVEHGGRIWAENHAGAGSEAAGATLIVELPLHPKPGMATIGQGDEADSGQDTPA
ncbi:MAG: ATP-binding protein [Phycisphaerales bacterium JB041]